MADRGLYFVQVLGRAGETAVFHDRLEGFLVYSDRVSRLFRLEINSIEIIRFPRTFELAYPLTR